MKARETQKKHNQLKNNNFISLLTEILCSGFGNGSAIPDAYFTHSFAQPAATLKPFPVPRVELHQLAL
ncbi:hypothetical protein ACWY5N_001088 [Citrobacter koseri]